MPRRVNKHGLSDYIEADIRRIVRKECGFGCVICGMAVADYEHFDPDFEDAVKHDPACIALLCGSCHGKVTRGLWSKDKVRAARANPITFAKGYARDVFDLQGPITIMLGGNALGDFRTIVRTREGNNWFEVHPPQEPGGPFEISAVFYDEAGQVSLEIDHNDWLCPTNVWDLDVEGSRLTIRRGLRQIALQLNAMPPDGLAIERLVMNDRHHSIVIDPAGTATIKTPSNSIEMTLCSAMGADAVILL